MLSFCKEKRRNPKKNALHKTMRFCLASSLKTDVKFSNGICQA